MINLDELIVEKNDLELKLSAIKLMIQAYRNDTEINIDEIEPVTKYESSLNNSVLKKGTWLQQILYIIDEKNRFMHNSELAEILKPFYKKKDMHNVKRRISSVLTHANANNKSDGLTNYRFSKSRKDTVWGRKEWLNENGEIINKYAFFNKEKSTKQSMIDF